MDFYSVCRTKTSGDDITRSDASKVRLHLRLTHKNKKMFSSHCMSVRSIIFLSSVFYLIRNHAFKHGVGMGRESDY